MIAAAQQIGEDTAMFTGYSGETLDFMWGIRFNNDRTWFNQHKEEYLQYLYQPTSLLPLILRNY